MSENQPQKQVQERLRHKGKFRLLVAVYGDTGGVNLHVSRICEVGTLAVASYCGATVAAHSVCQKDDYIEEEILCFWRCYMRF